MSDLWIQFTYISTFITDTQISSTGYILYNKQNVSIMFLFLAVNWKGQERSLFYVTNSNYCNLPLTWQVLGTLIIRGKHFSNFYVRLPTYVLILKILGMLVIITIQLTITCIQVSIQKYFSSRRPSLVNFPSCIREPYYKRVCVRLCEILEKSYHRWHGRNGWQRKRVYGQICQRQRYQITIDNHEIDEQKMTNFLEKRHIFQILRLSHNWTNFCQITYAYRKIHRNCQIWTKNQYHYLFDLQNTVWPFRHHIRQTYAFSRHS